ncbi:DUF535 family protein [Paraherbaspirillum soli]|uniref:DUF535 family protein n=1 Tax=Paraherbaspirillum soli TaxID=631222 RepID=A0ABW0ME19_9BURK
MILSSYNHSLWSSFGAPTDVIGIPLMLALALAEWSIYLVPTSLAAIWIRGNKAIRLTSVKALVTAVGAVLLSRAIAVLWDWSQPAAETGDSYLDLATTGHYLSPSVKFAIILAAGLSLWTAKTIKTKWLGLLLVALSLVVGWARVFLGMHCPLDIFCTGIVSLAMMLAVNSKFGTAFSRRITGLIDHGYRNLALLPELSHQNASRVTLRSCLAHSRPGLSYVAKQVKVTARTFAHYHLTRRWLAYWNTSPMHAALAKATPRLLQKIYRPYQSIRLRRQDRLNILISHYNFVLQQGLGPLVLLATRSPVVLGSFSGKSGAAYEIRLSAIATLDREGELTLDLCCDQQRLFSVAFTFCGNELQPCVGIGCLQGPRGSDAQERVRSATRDMFGLRPKSLMVRLVREIGQAYGCKNLILVANRNRVMVHQMRKGQVFADYDEFWQELGAVRRADGDFQLLCGAIPAPDLQEIPSHKRSEARKRIDLIQRAVQATRAGFSNTFAGA